MAPFVLSPTLSCQRHYTAGGRDIVRSTTASEQAPGLAHFAAAEVAHSRR